MIDGDTIKVDLDGTETTIRLCGVDCPETKDPREPVQPYGPEAAAFTKNLLEGESVWLSYEPTNLADRWHRTIAYVWRAPDGLFVNLELVRDGYGYAQTEWPCQYVNTLVAYEARAKEQSKGLWLTENEAKQVSNFPSPASPLTLESSRVATLPDESEAEVEPVPDNQPQDGDDSIIVHITKSGGKYHRAGCRYLNKSDYTITLAEAKAKGLEPCSVCDPPC